MVYLVFWEMKVFGVLSWKDIVKKGVAVFKLVYVV